MLSNANSVLQNKLLITLSRNTGREWLSQMEPVTLKLGDVLSEANQPIGHVYFPDVGMVSLTAQMHEGNTVEIVTIGNDGMVGLSALLGTKTLPFRAYVQVPGHGLRMAVGTFQGLVAKSQSVSDLLQRYVQTIFVQAGQSSACNRVHSIRHRCAKWLLTAQDRVGNVHFSLTQRFLAEMLGVRRAGVNEVCRQLQQEGLIRYSRGHITILDRPGLETAACDCYRVIRGEYERLFS